jgi:SpoVK/Ycf46/Vps4 family AAA+-type ATPase/tetratricopeptide (TPR) repeat protein
LNDEELNELLTEAFEHLRQGRHRMALTAAKKVNETAPADHRTAACLAWAYLENGNTAQALELANYAVELSQEVEPRLYRGFILMRLGIFEGALRDLDYAIEKKPKLLSWAFINKARALAGCERYFEALEEIEHAIDLNEKKDDNLLKLRKWYRRAAGIKIGLFGDTFKSEKELLEDGEEALKQQEFWFSIWAAKNILDNPAKADQHIQAHLLMLEAMVALFQFKPAYEKAVRLEESVKAGERFELIFKKITQNYKPSKEDEKAYKEQSKFIRRTDLQKFNDAFIKTIHCRVFNLDKSKGRPSRLYCLQFNSDEIRYVGAEIIILNPAYNTDNVELSGESVWMLDDAEIGRHPFELKIKKEWKDVVFVQSWGAEIPGFWKEGNGKVEIYIDKLKICERWFSVGHTEIPDEEEIVVPGDEIRFTKSDVDAPQKEQETKTADSKTLEELLAELDKFTGLKSVKEGMRSFINYLKFVQDRKKMGLKTQEALSLHTVFLGNPGTGKTTVARLLGNIFKAMGLLPQGHVVEVDRTALVGQYIGETGQKTDKVLNDAMGGVLFIDEAYTLSKKASGMQDFGQEAIDIIMKRMEDKGSELAVVVAGYPEEMNVFLDSNPGMKSRFSHYFTFEDYEPKELIEIFTGMAKAEEYSVEQKAIELLEKEFTELYRKRDQTFGNARLVRNFLNEAKMNLSSRYLKLPENEKNKEALTTIIESDIEEIFKKGQKSNVSIPINEEALAKALEKLEKLTGLDSVKKEINEIVKLARYYKEQGQDIEDKFLSHVLFLGNPGTGKTTVARIFSEIYSAIGLLPKGHLVEVDRQGLVSSYVGQTAEKTKAVIDKAIGGTLFIDEAYTLVKKGDSGSDFGKEAIDTLLKRMEDDKGKFIVIAAGYTEEMNAFIESNPGIKSRFSKTLLFEDYSPDNLMEIFLHSLSEKSFEADEEAKDKVKKYFNELYRNRDKNFGNARIVRNLLDEGLRKQLLRVADIPAEQRIKEEIRQFKAEDVKFVIDSRGEKRIVKIEGDKEKLDELLSELKNLTGIQSVKNSVEKLISGLRVAKLREERGLKVIPKNLHSVFLGNPGTGKTTIARLISRIYKEMGLLEKGHLVETDRAGLVAGYQGQTAIKTDEVIQKAIGGTLFIDEAYTLVRGGNDFGQEAIDTLLKKMEDLQGQFVVIVAGYPNEMKSFIDTNPGLESRFTNYFMFEDFTPRQMLEILASLSEKNGYKLDEGAWQLLLEVFTDLYTKRDKNFGNARTVKNIFYEAISNQEERLNRLSLSNDEDLITITMEDIGKLNISAY